MKMRQGKLMASVSSAIETRYGPLAVCKCILEWMTTPYLQTPRLVGEYMMLIPLRFQLTSTHDNDGSYVKRRLENTNLCPENSDDNATRLCAQTDISRTSGNRQWKMLNP